MSSHPPPPSSRPPRPPSLTTVVARFFTLTLRYFLFFAKYGGIALFGTLLYSLYQGDTTALRSTLTTASSLVGSAASLGGLSSLASVAAWWIGADNTEAVKNVGAYAAKFFSPDSSTATTKRSKKKQSNSNAWDSFLPNGEGSGSPSGNTRSKKKVDNPNSLFEDVFGETPKRAGGAAAAGDAGGIVNGFLDKVVHAAGGENALKLKKLAEQALNAAPEAEKEADKGWFGQGTR